MVRLHLNVPKTVKSSWTTNWYYCVAFVQHPKCPQQRRGPQRQLSCPQQQPRFRLQQKSRCPQPLRCHNNNRAAYNDTLEWVSINSFSILGLYKFILHLDLYRVPTERELWLNIILFQGSSVIIELFHSYILIETAFRIKILDSICRFSL